ncbi:hypothetical protein J0895_12880 [Phormidium pseudopriestleyi FRX01]|uniref:Uncharacterized protein n=1 Tax=Phormidium pseudopriestleyi FRX01 TaxID=1759528 RepID=A0ABS3FS93_9CYAN|nr:hypothetical protein [Phormidium pseudopriestleyi]MBO0349990.1 hypothetical protein [Phormidium pseudopriestleyi FRX01]
MGRTLEIRLFYVPDSPKCNGSPGEHTPGERDEALIIEEIEELRSGRLQDELHPAYCKQPSSCPLQGVKNS